MKKMSKKASKSDKFKGLSVKQVEVISLVVKGVSVENACEKTKINPSTYYRWLSKDAFKQALKDISNSLCSLAIQELKNEVKNAVITLKMLLRAESPYIKRLVANDILSYYFRDREIDGIESRLSKIEKALNLKEGR